MRESLGGLLGTRGCRQPGTTIAAGRGSPRTPGRASPPAGPRELAPRFVSRTRPQPHACFGTSRSRFRIAAPTTAGALQTHVDVMSLRRGGRAGMMGVAAGRPSPFAGSTLPGSDPGTPGLSLTGSISSLSVPGLPSRHALQRGKNQSSQSVDLAIWAERNPEAASAAGKALTT